jgi:ABC-2 type transport system permease protein
MKRLQTSVKDMLADLQAYSHSKLQFEFTDPLQGLRLRTSKTGL